ncbi:MAG: DUF2177 family protein [Anaerolineales bacterium]|jgi:uncharacterized membrane protein|nr:DUF2177 family protein [Anaerolineales bacterium]
MKTFLKHYLLTLLPFLILDAIWLGLITPQFYRAQIGHLMADQMNWPAAAIFYGLYVAGLVFFVTGAAIRSGDLRQALLRGALFGFMTYATYDLTNQASLRDWPALMTLVDLAWGTSLGAVTALGAVWLGRKI